MSENYLEKIDEYLADRMSPTERAAFEVLIESDTALKEELTYAKLAIELGEFSLEKDVDELVRSSLKKEKEASNNEPKVKSGSKRMAIVILIVLLCSFLLYLIPHKDEDKSKDEVTIQFVSLYEEPIWPLKRNESDSLQLAISLHLSGRTDEALTILLNKPQDRTYKYWAAEVMVNGKRCAEAKILLKELKSFDIEKERVKMMGEACGLEL